MQDSIIIDNLRVEFPYVPYDCQQSFMAKVVAALNSSSNAALESPTGTGKTLSLLCASIAWLQHEKERLRPQINGDLIKPANSAKVTESTSASPLFPKIYYASRTHSQLQQVVRELNKTPYKSLIKVATLAGREQLCINERVMKEPNSEVKGHICRTMVKGHKCHYYNKLDKDSDVVDEMYRNETAGDVLDIEDLITVSKKLRHCPFYRSRQLDREADLILLPYNYLLDPKTRDAYEIKLRGNILIFDEAHNLESIAEESVSICFTTKTLALSIEECKRTLELIYEEEENIRAEMDNSTVTLSSLMGNSKKDKKRENLIPSKNEVSALLAQLHHLSDVIADTDFKALGKPFANQDKMKGFTFSGVFLVSLLEKVDFTRANKSDVCRLIDKMGVFLANGIEKNSMWDVRGANLGEFANFLSKVYVDTFEGVEHIEYNGKFQKTVKFSKADAYDFFKVFVVVDENRIKINYWCFSAGVAMRFLQSRGVHSIILTSGTLAPLPQFISTMAIPFPHTLENEHAAKSNQLIVGALSKGRGVVGANIHGNYQRSSELSYKMSIGDLLLQTVRVTPQGVLVFFPSYTKMNDCVKCWKDTKTDSESGHLLWSLLEQHKKIFIEPTDKAQLSAEFCNFDAAIRGEGLTGSQNGGLFLAVCRGKLSEGIDFADSHSRAVFIVGIPLPPFYDEKVILKKEFLNDRSKKNPQLFINGENWYQLEGYRAVNQALGRIIRHKDDFGAVVLADSRYSSSATHKMFPMWIRSSVNVYDNPNTLFDRIQRFFEERGVLVERSRVRLLEQSTRKEDASRKRKRIQWASDVESRNQEMITDIFDVYGDAIREKCGVTTARLTIAKNDELQVLNNVLNNVSVLPDSAKKFQRHLTLCANTNEYSQRAFDKVAVDMQKPLAKRRIKLKANVKLNDDAKSAVSAKIRQFQEGRGGGDSSSVFSQMSNDGVSDSQLLNGLASHGNSAASSEPRFSPKFERPTLKCKKEEPLYTAPTNMPADFVSSRGVQAPLKTSIKSILKNGPNSPATSVDRSANESMESAIMPPPLSVEEYTLLMNNLDRMKKLRLMQAQKAYLQNKNYDILITALRTIALPNDPLVFTGFHSFLQEEHKRMHVDICRSLHLL